MRGPRGIRARGPDRVDAWHLSLAMGADLVAVMVEELRRRGVENETTRQVAEVIRKQFGGAAVYVRAVEREERDAKAKELLRLGASAKLVARETGLHPATVRRKRSAWL